MILEVGEKIHIMERRFFNEELRRHFIGEVVAIENTLIRVKGYPWVFDTMKNEFIRKPELRERVVNIGERLTINVIPSNVDVGKVKYVFNKNKGLVVNDGANFSLDITEFSVMR